MRLAVRRQGSGNAGHIPAAADAASGNARAPRLWLGRTSAVAALVILPAVGASVAASAHRSPDFGVGAQAVIAVDPDARAVAEPQGSQLLSEAVDLRQVASAASVRATSDRSIDEILDHTDVTSVPGSTIVRIDVEEESQTRALALANAIALSAADFLRQLIGTGVNQAEVVGNFEEPTSDWGTAPSVFSTPASRLAHANGTAKAGSASLSVDCPPAPACGPTVRVYSHFVDGETYIAEGYFRSQQRVPMTLVFGANPDDLTNSAVERGDDGWVRLRAEWTPLHPHDVAEVGFQTAWGARAADYFVDAVTIRGPGTSEAAARKALGGSDVASVSAARPTGSTGESGTTVRWALAGALGGLAVAGLAVAMGNAAQRRQQPE
jgi:hypothetical protein